MPTLSLRRLLPLLSFAVVAACNDDPLAIGDTNAKVGDGGSAGAPGTAGSNIGGANVGGSNVGGSSVGGSNVGGATTDVPVFARAWSGARLRAKRVSSGPGATAAVGLRDTLLGFDCEPQTLYDGSERCAPTTTATTYGNTFTDAACTIPAAAVSASDAAEGSYATTVDDSSVEAQSCPSPHVVVLGPPATTFYVAGTTGCVATAGLAFPTTDADPTILVAVTTTSSEPRGPALLAEIKTFEDGARIATGRYTDVAHAGACDLTSPVADDEDTCFPQLATANGPGSFPGANAFSRDATCATADVVRPDPVSFPCQKPTSGWASTGDYGIDFCPDDHTYSRLGAPYSGPLFAKSDEGACTAYAPMAGDSFYALGAPLAAGEIPRAAVQPIGTAPVPVRASVAADGTPIAAHGFADANGHACSLLAIGDASFCAPSQRPVATPPPTYFGDAACTQALLQLYPPHSISLSDGCLTETLLPSYVFADADYAQVAPIGAVHPGLVYSLVNGSCGSPTEPGNFTNFGEGVPSFYEMGSFVDATTALPRLTVSIE